MKIGPGRSSMAKFTRSSGVRKAGPAPPPVNGSDSVSATEQPASRLEVSALAKAYSTAAAIYSASDIPRAEVVKNGEKQVNNWRPLNNRQAEEVAKDMMEDEAAFGGDNSVG